jgi:hypothetical protein
LSIAACGIATDNAEKVRAAQKRSHLGSLKGWRLDAALDGNELQRMRDRAYAFCLDKPASAICERDQDLSLWAYADSFRLVRIFRADPAPTFPFAVSHSRDPGAFKRVRRYCEGVYRDLGAGDARMLGPCMSDGVGGDFFGIIAVD